MYWGTSYPLPGVPTPHQLHSRPATSPEEGDIHRIEEPVNHSCLNALQSSHPRRAAGVGEGHEEEESGPGQSTGPQRDERVIDEGRGRLDGTNGHYCEHVHTQCQQGEQRHGHLILHLQHCQTSSRIKNTLQWQTKVWNWPKRPAKTSLASLADQLKPD